jgi:S1-C subfamily serine protease
VLAYTTSLAAQKSTRADASEDDRDRRLARLEASLRHAHDAVDLLAALTAERFERAARRPASELARALLQPSIHVSMKSGAGSGTIVWSRGGETYALTAFHVVSRAIQRDEDGRETRRPVAVTVYRADGTVDERLEAEVVLWHEKKDLALLRLRSSRTFATARLAARDAGTFTPVYAVGCPLGHDPLPTAGEIASVRKDVQGERFWMMTAPTIFGNSGGGVYHRETLELVGVSVMICTFDNPNATPVPHLGILVPLSAIRAWLAAHDHAFVVDPAAPRAGALARREW